MGRKKRETFREEGIVLIGVLVVLFLVFAFTLGVILGRSSLTDKYLAVIIGVIAALITLFGVCVSQWYGRKNLEDTFLHTEELNKQRNYEEKERALAEQNHEIRMKIQESQKEKLEELVMVFLSWSTEIQIRSANFRYFSSIDHLEGYFNYIEDRDKKYAIHNQHTNDAFRLKTLLSLYFPDIYILFINLALNSNDIISLIRIHAEYLQTPSLRTRATEEKIAELVELTSLFDDGVGVINEQFSLEIERINSL